MNHPDLEERARQFWAGTGLEQQLPRPIEQAVALQLPIAVIKLPVVNLRAVGAELQSRRIVASLPRDRRDLMGFLYAHRGHGFIFVCGADSAEEQRFTVAHDTAHFLVDYWWPRQRVLAELGPAAVEVLDGRRRATPAELAASVLAHVRLGPYCHLLPRAGQGEAGAAVLAGVEERADLLGLELVAPRERIEHALRTLPPRQREDAELACLFLGGTFGLPPGVFADLLFPRRLPRAPSFFEEVVLPMRKPQ
jgi:hypothetical protein